MKKTLKQSLIISLLFNISYADDNVSWYEKTVNVYDKTVKIFADKKLTVSEKRTIHFNKIWKDIFDDLDDGATLEEKFLTAPESAWLSADKKDIREDIDQILNDIIEYLSKDDLLSYKDEITSINEEIDDKNKDILAYREKMIGAPESSTIHTTKDDYKEKIKNTKDEILILKNDIKIIKKRLTTNLNSIGINLNEKQIDILLTRVDGDDFVQMNLAMDVLSQITQQLMQLMRASNEELKQAKKYYAMHLISFELLVKIQQKYIDKLDNVYLPKIDKMIIETNDIIINTTDKLQNTENKKRRMIYKKNLENQKLTLNVAKLYKNQMLKQRDKLIKAQNISKENLELANNTYQTVRLSANLYDLMEENQEIFNNVMAIQIPEIVPFENIQIENKYKELTTILQQD